MSVSTPKDQVAQPEGETSFSKCVKGLSLDFILV